MDAVKAVDAVHTVDAVDVVDRVDAVDAVNTVDAVDAVDTVNAVNIVSVDLFAPTPTASTAWGYNDFLHQHLLHTAYLLHPLHGGTITYLLSTLCQLTFLHQHLLRPLRGVTMTFCTNTYCILRTYCIHCMGVQ